MPGFNQRHLSTPLFWQRFDIRLGGSVESIRNFLGDGDGLAERYGAAHRVGVAAGDQTLVAEYLFGERVDAADQLRCVVGVDLSGLVGDHLQNGRRHVALIQREDQHPIVGQQAPLDSLAKADAVNLLAVELQVIHRA